MSPHPTYTRIPMQVGSELRIRNTGELSVVNRTVEGGVSLEAADAVLDYRFDANTGEHVIRLTGPTSRRRAR